MLSFKNVNINLQEDGYRENKNKKRIGLPSRKQRNL